MSPTVSDAFLLPTDPRRSGPSHPWGVVYRHGSTLSLVEVKPFRTEEEANTFRESILKIAPTP